MGQTNVIISTMLKFRIGTKIESEAQIAEIQSAISAMARIDLRLRLFDLDGNAYTYN